jgi:hypothetical protein
VDRTFPNSLHVYAPFREHEEVYIIGDSVALTRLRDACDVLLQGVAPNCAFESTAADGEGFRAFVVLLPESDPRWGQLEFPYVSGDTPKNSDSGKEPLSPMGVMGVERYRELAQKLKDLDP